MTLLRSSRDNERLPIAFPVDYCSRMVGSVLKDTQIQALFKVEKTTLWFGKFKHILILVVFVAKCFVRIKEKLCIKKAVEREASLGQALIDKESMRDEILQFLISQEKNPSINLDTLLLKRACDSNLSTEYALLFVHLVYIWREYSNNNDNNNATSHHDLNFSNVLRLVINGITSVRAFTHSLYFIDI